LSRQVGGIPIKNKDKKFDGEISYFNCNFVRIN
jgi:hypothetical protein